MYITVIIRPYTTQVINLWYLQKKFGFLQWPIAQDEFQIRITQQIRNRFRKNVVNETGA